MGKKKLKDDGIYFCGNNAVDVTGSCIYIKNNGKHILLECGLVQNNDYLENYKSNSEKFKFNPNDIDYVFVNHVHTDHAGLLPRLVREGFSGKVICTTSTALLMKSMLLNSAFILKGEAAALSYRYKRNYSPIYDEDDVYRVLELIDTYDDCHKEYFLDDIVSFEWYQNSHCIGSRQLRLSLINSSGVKQHILYTSDIGALNTDNHYLPDTEICTKPIKYAIIESTYGEPGRVNKKTRSFDIEHLRVAINTVMERGGVFIMPCFSFSRTQEILTNLYEIYHDDPSFIYDVVVDSILTVDICNLYNELLTGEDLELWLKVRSWENVKFITEKDDSLACVKSHTPKVVLSSSGFCTNGRILSYLHEYLSDSNSMVAFSGYVGDNNSYLSYRIKNYKDNKIIKISGDPVKNDIDCISLTTFSSHANRKNLIEYGSSVNAEKLILVHGTDVAKNSLKDDIKKELSKKNRTHRVIAASKDMFLKL